VSPIGLDFVVPEERIEDTAYYLQSVGENAEQAEPVLWDIVDKILAREKRMFESRGATSGVYWTPLKGETVKWKVREGSSTPLEPLRFYGSLMKSLTEKGARYQVLDVDDKGLFLETRHPAAGYHASGTSKMARRPPLIIPAKHAQEYIGMLNDFIFEEGDYAR
jgi:hypothetical protein